MASKFKSDDSSTNETDIKTVELDIIQCFNSSNILSLKTLKEKLPCISEELIKLTLSTRPNFFEVSSGTFTLISKIKFDDAECKEIRSLVEIKLSSNNFISLNSIAVKSNAKLNPWLTEAALKNIIFELYLSNEYSKRSNLITLKGSNITGAGLIRDYCTTNKIVYYNNLCALEADIYGRNQGNGLLFACNHKFRIDHHTFIPVNAINFDVEATDTAINSFMQKDVIPLQAVSSFSSFPFVEGCFWNWFLLESYCRHYSKLFNYQCLDVNSLHVGAIFKKSLRFPPEYQNVLAYIIVNDALALDKKFIGKYFYDYKYVAKSEFPSLGKTIELARTLYKKTN
jgi:hypothetical protein